MAYRLRPAESAGPGLRRLAKSELQSARDGLQLKTPPRDEAIHEARKSVKKARAIARLIRADDGSARGRKRLRKVNRTLSALRDADAMPEILEKLRNRNPGMLSGPTFERIRDHLSSHKQRLLEEAGRNGTWDEVDEELRDLRQSAKRWQPTHRRFGALAAGIRDTYQRGLTAMLRARQGQRAADFHEWRKQMKGLWYQLRLIEGCSTRVREDASALHRAESQLGDEHNLVVLCAQLNDPLLDAPIDVESLARALERYQCELRRKAIAGTRRIYAHTPDDYVRRVKCAWNAWELRERVAPRPRQGAA